MIDNQASSLNLEPINGRGRLTIVGVQDVVASLADDCVVGEQLTLVGIWIQYC